MFAKLYSAVYVWHRPGAPLDPLRAVGAVQAGAAVGAEVVAGLYVDHRVHPHMGHSFFLPAAIHHAPGSAPYYSCQQARCLRQRLPCLCAHMRQSCRMRGSPVKCGQPVQAPTEPHGPGLDAYRSLTGRFRGPSGCMGQDGVPGRQGSRPSMPFPLSLRSRRLFVSPSSPSAWSPYPSSACAGSFPALVSFRRLS